MIVNDNKGSPKFQGVNAQSDKKAFHTQFTPPTPSKSEVNEPPTPDKDYINGKPASALTLAGFFFIIPYSLISQVPAELLPS